MAREPKSMIDDGVVGEADAVPEQAVSTPEESAKPFDPNAHSMEISRIIREAWANENSSALRGEIARLKDQVRQLKAGRTM